MSGDLKLDQPDTPRLPKMWRPDRIITKPSRMLKTKISECRDAASEETDSETVGSASTPGSTQELGHKGKVEPRHTHHLILG